MLSNQWRWATLGATALLIRVIASQFPESTEVIYSRSIFPVLRNIMDISISRLPFPAVYLFFGAVFLTIGIFLYRLKNTQGLQRRFRYAFRSLTNIVGLLVFFFLFLWGFNYSRIPVYQQLSLQPDPLSQDELLQEIQLTAGILSRLRGEITQDSLAITETVPFLELENRVRVEIKKSLPLLGFSSSGHPRAKQFYPAGFLRRMGILGIYFPYTGESYIDPTLHPLEKPFTVAHEMAHSFGITNEGEANFISWVLCANSGDVLLQYSSQLQLFRYQLNDLYRTNRESYQRILSTTAVGVKNDIKSILLNARKIKPISLELSRKSNDLFLKTQGIKAGVKSYAQLPMLAYAWRTSRGMG